MQKINIEVGTMFGELKYLGEAGYKELPSGQKPRLVLCKCKCGNSIPILFLHLYRGRIKSCKCSIDNESVKDKGTKLHNIWRSINSRTKEYVKGHGRKSYFEKGITVCKEWTTYSIFKQWGLKNGFIEGLQIDRIKNNLGYFPSNCRFVTQIVNMSNRDITVFVKYKGRILPFMDLSREFNFDKTRVATTYNRIKRGWTAEKAFDTKINDGNYLKGKLHPSYINSKRNNGINIVSAI